MFPELNIPAIKAKVDTGARTSALHAFYVTPFDRSGIKMVKFGIHPDPKNSSIERHCEAELIDQRSITNSGGHSELRHIIKTPITLGDHTWDIKISLTNRETMKFRMLLGRTAMKNKIIVDPSKSYCFGKKLASIYK